MQFPHPVRLLPLAVMLGFNFLLQFYISSHSPLLHSVFCVVIILSSFWYGLAGGLVSSIICSAIYAPDIILSDRISFELFGHFSEIIMFLIIGTLTGILAEKLKREKEYHRKASEKLREFLDQLRIQSERLSQIQDQLRHAERMSILGEISASIAHEIRGPVANLKGAADILMNELQLDDEAEQFLRIIIKEAERLARIADVILKSAKYVPGDIKLCDINELVASSLALTEQKAKRSGISVRFDRGDIPAVYGDPDSLRQVFVNIIDNAIDAMRNGGILEINTSLVKSEDGRGSVEITFSDNGEGLDDESLKKIFQPFFTTKPYGTGLGLSISRRIVERHGGMISVESERGKGSVFRVKLPLDGDQPGYM